MTFSERKEIGLPDRTSLTEFYFNTYSPCAFTLALNADEFLGGEDVANYTNHINHIVSNFQKSNSQSLKEVSFKSSTTPYVMAYDGSFMNQQNGLFISEDKKAIENYIGKITNPDVTIQWLLALGKSNIPDRTPEEEKKKILVKELWDHLSKFAESRFTNEDLLKILIQGSKDAAKKMADFIDIIDNDINFPRFDNIA